MVGQEACSDHESRQYESHTLEEAKGVFAKAVVSQATTTGHGVLGVGSESSALLLSDHVRESSKRKGLLVGEAGTAAPDDVHQTNNVSPIMGEEDARSFKDRDVAWILARRESRKRNKQPCSLDFSSFQMEMLRSTDIQNFLIEGARIGAILGQAESSFDMGGPCPTEVAGMPNPEAAIDGVMDPLTPEMVQQTWGRTSPSSSADDTTSPEQATDHPGGAACTHPVNMPNGAAPMPAKEQDTITVTHKSSSRRARPRAREQVTKPEVQPNTTAADKSPRKRKYMPKIRAENPKPRSRAKKARVGGENASPPEVTIPETSSPSLRRMKSFARINQRRPKRQRRGKAAAAIVFKDSPPAAAAGCAACAPGVPSSTVPPGITPIPAAQDAIAQSADFLRFLHECLFADHPIKLNCESPLPPTCPADRLPESNQAGSSFGAADPVQVEPCSTRTPCPSVPSATAEPRVEVHHSTSAEDPPSTPRGPVPFVSTCRDFSLVMSPWSPPSSHGASEVADMWNNFDDEREIAHVSATTVRRTLKFDAVQLDAQPLLHENADLSKDSPQLDVAAHIAARVEVSELPQVAMETAAPSEAGRGKELQMVAYDEGAKRMVVYKKAPRVRRVRYKPKVNLDASTVKMFKTLTIKAGAEGEDSEEHEKASWERSRHIWQNRAHHFISIMRQVQGNRSFTRWKGSVVDSVGGAFLTQNVSDFLSSNAFIALRARFPARPRNASVDGTETTSTISPPVEREASIPRPVRPTAVELKQQRKGDDRRQEEASKRATALLHSNNVNENSSTRVDEQSLSDIVEILRIGLIKYCHIAPRNDGNAKAPEMFIARQNIIETTEQQTSHDFASEELDLVKRSYDPTLVDAPAQGVMPPDSVNRRPSAADGEVDELDLLMEPPPPSGKGKLASGVIQRKFSGVVTESVSSLTAIGKEKVLAATLRLVLGKKHTSRELGLTKGMHKALKNLKLRPARTVLRSSTDNYRYRHNVSFRLLSGEARATWEAGFVMKSQKAKWEPLRAAILADEHYCRDPLTEDCVDWEAVQKASVHEVADVIKNRGMNNALAGRMKAFLDRVHRDQKGRMDLEWIRKLPPEDAKAFLLSFRGVGIKSVECIRLLTLHHPSFPVDTNVGRILVRLGWVPLEPLPEETQLHLLELYPIQSQIQQYAWPRLCTLDQKTLYELHYQMITFGKVFCTKSKPNCNACPLRTECKHYASSYASAKLLLKGPGKQEQQSTTILALQGTDPTPVQTESTQDSTLSTKQPCVPIIELEPCIPIIEEPRSPEPNTTDTSVIPDIEELPLEVLDFGASGSVAGSLVLTGELCMSLEGKKTLLDLNREPEPDLYVLPAAAADAGVNLEKRGMDHLNMRTVLTVESKIQVALENITQVTVEDDVEVLPGSQAGVPDDFKHLPSQELILLPPQVSLAPAPKLKNIQRLRTVHFVYELPDNHPLLFEMDKREADDPCFYLLAIWSPDEVPATMPKINDDDSMNPFASCDESCSVDAEQTTVRGTLLIPCKTAMRGWFPLNGTYFQVNEVFADHASSVQPIDVPRTLLWSLRRRFVYFSTAVSNLFKDMSQEEIQCCFQKGYVCLRAFDVATRQPKILAPRLHQSGAKIVKAPAPRKSRGRDPGRRKTPIKDKPQTKTTENPPSEEAALMDNENVLTPEEAPAMPHK